MLERGVIDVVPALFDSPGIEFLPLFPTLHTKAQESWVELPTVILNATARVGNFLQNLEAITRLEVSNSDRLCQCA